MKVNIKDQFIELTLKQKLFCEYYVSDNLFGNGVQSYIEAYKPDESKKNWYKTAKSAAYENLTKHDLLKYINFLLEEAGLNDSFFDKQLLFLATQHSCFSSKLGAIKEYNKLKSRITTKLEVEDKTETREEIISRIEKLRKIAQDRLNC